MRSIRCVEHEGKATMITPFVGDQHITASTFGFDIPTGCESGYQSKKKVPRNNSIGKTKDEFSLQNNAKFRI